MKLIICENCNDIVALHTKLRLCLCRQSYGWYIDDIDAVIGGKAIPIGINNYSLLQALQNRPQNGNGKIFEAFVIPKQCNSITKEK